MSGTAERGSPTARVGGLPLVTAGDREALGRALAEDIAGRLGEAIEARGAASLVVSGGSTPAPMFAALARADIDWSKVVVTLADERWVAPDHEDSNEALVRRTLLVGRAAEATFVPLYREAPSPEAALGSVHAALAETPRPFDVVVLGMGNDAHTASLFPDAPELERAMSERDSLVWITRPPSVAQARITLTAAALLDSRHCVLHVCGADKREVLEQAMGGPPPRAPIARLLSSRAEGVALYWSA